ncbi:MAG: hypothetical protein Q8M92_09505, partial [Candidatus Subteraquimicrobiales bacterium]|nr:hypothetical protein [Candidatus Subteraquimicrobiales bacterium]
MKLASIDIGTNSTRLMIAEADKENLRTITRLAEITRLGENVDRTHLIKDEAAKQTIETLLKYAKLLEKEKVVCVRTVATSALRDAENSLSFLRLVKEKTGLDVEILSGEEEAALAFNGATYDYRGVLK